MRDVVFFLEVGGKVVHSLEELEARMRGGAPPPATSTEAPRVNKTEEDLAAFKKLVRLVYLIISLSPNFIELLAKFYFEPLN